MSQYGNIIGFYVGNEPAVVLAEFELIKTVMKRDDVAARPSLRPFCDLRPGHWVVDKENEGKVPGVIFTQGKFWTEQRRFVLRVLRDFGFGKASMEDTIVDEVDKLCDELQNLEGSPFNIQRKLNISILNALWALLVGEKLQLKDPKLLNIVELLDRALRGQNPTQALASMFPFPEMIRWPIISHLLMDLDAFKNGINNVKLLVEPYVKEHKSSLDEDNIRDFLDAYLIEINKHQNDKESSFHRERGHYMLINVLIDLFIAGMETTSSAIVWTILLLLHHPEIKRKVHEEIDKVRF